MLHVVYSLLLQVGYRRAEVGVVYPVARGVGPLVTMLVAVALLGERPGLAALGGGLIVIAEIAVVTSSALHTRGTRFGPGLRYGVAVGLAIASYTLWDDHAVTDLGLHPLTYFGVAVTFQSLILLPSAVHRRALIVPALRTSWLPAALVAVLSPTAYILVLFAMQTTPVSLVAPPRESSIVIGSLAGWLIFREPKPLRRVAGASVVLGGIALIATA
ncbi:EamA family transporter [Paramicrobacterium sp. CJ85]|uniref:EamA family transporter n=1 Tax=Paramicrobacterium sp. CJ85 TaxID=3445355 RepID=UPI003F5FEF65